MDSPPIPPGARAAWLLGLLGLVPFFVGAALLWVRAPWFGSKAYSVPRLLIAYGATIASFLGGVRWGVEVARGPSARNLVLSVTPQLAAWALASAAGLPLPLRLYGLAVLLMIQGLGDMTAKDLPSWYRSLRAPLTLGAVLSMAAMGAWAQMMAKLYGG